MAKTYSKKAVPRHRKLCRTSAHRCEKALETRIRRHNKVSKQEIESTPQSRRDPVTKNGLPAELSGGDNHRCLR